MLRFCVDSARDQYWLDQHDPSLGIKRPKTQGNSIVDRAKEITATLNRWPVGRKQRLAFALMLYTGQRRSDGYRMTWGDVSGTTIRVITQPENAA